MLQEDSVRSQIWLQNRSAKCSLGLGSETWLGNRYSFYRNRNSNALLWIKDYEYCLLYLWDNCFSGRYMAGLLHDIYVRQQ